MPRIKIVSLLLLAGMLLTVLCACTQKVPDDETGGMRIGVCTGTIFDTVVEKNLDRPLVSYFNSNPDLALALEKGKIDGYATDEPIARLLAGEYPDHCVSRKFADEEYAFAFKKGGRESERLCGQMNAFLEKCRKDGTIERLDEIWFGQEESLKTVDMSGLTAENGTLVFSTTTDIGAPFSYIKDNRFVGYDIDIAVRFCREYGYGIEIVNTSFAGLIADISAGKSDFAGACITITAERSEKMLFSDANYVGGSVLVTKGTAAKINSLEELSGKKIGAQTGVAYDTVAQERIPGCEIVYYNSAADLAIALGKGKVDGYLVDEPVAQMLLAQYEGQKVLSVLREEDYAFPMPRSNPGSTKLCAEMNAFFARCREDGSFAELADIWLGADASRQTVDYSGLRPTRGTLTMAICSAVGAPFCYIKDNAYAGYDLDLAVRFCRAYGYALRVVDYDAPGLFTCLAAGRCDFGACCIAITEERRETMLFSDPYYRGGIAVVTKGAAPQAEEGGYDFFRSVGESFQKTFIREERYLLFLRGIGTTLLVVALSLVFGTVLGFAVYLAYYRAGRGFRRTVDLVIRVIDDTPVVVILMILYYLVFGSVDISGTAVSVIGFTMIFTGSVIGVMKVGVGAVDAGQREAALALGYSENKAFMKLILPQAAVHFLPGYKSAIVQLIKGTAIVGYIAVQDLTKVSDIVRSRTYEAFFPLIVTALLYFLFAAAISLLIKRLEINVDPASRKRIRLLRGVKTK